MYKKILKIASVFGLLCAEPILAGNFLPTQQEPQQIQTITTTNTATSSQFTQINSTNVTNTTTITYVNNVPVNIVLDGTLYTTSQTLEQQNTEESQYTSTWETEENSGSGNGYAVAYGEGGEVVFIQNEDIQTQEYSGAGVNNVEVVNEETLIQILEGLIIDAQAHENNIEVYNVENNVQNIENINSGNNITVVVIGTQNNIGTQVVNPPAEEVTVESEEQNEESSDNDDTNESSDSDQECEENGGKGLKCSLHNAGEDIKDAAHDVKNDIKDAVHDVGDGIKNAFDSLFHHD